MHDGVMCRDKASNRGRGSIPPPTFVVWAVYAAVVGAGEEGAVPVGFGGARACVWARRQAAWAGAVLVMLAGVATSFVSAPAVSAQDRHCHWDGDDGSWFDGGS